MGPPLAGLVIDATTGSLEDSGISVDLFYLNFHAVFCFPDELLELSKSDTSNYSIAFSICGTLFCVASLGHLLAALARRLRRDKPFA